MRKIDIEKAKEYFKESIISNHIIQKDIISKILNSKKNKQFKYAFLRNKHESLKSIVQHFALFEMNNIEESKNEYKKYFDMFNVSDEKEKKEIKNFFKELYDKFIKQEELIYNFIKCFDTKACPYCNEYYVYSKKEGKIRPEFDHFLPKSEYPLFAMCFYNLIPSCHQCNHKKLAKTEKLLHPFYESFDDYKKFAVIPNSTSINNERDFEIGIQNKLSKENDFMNVKVFKLEERYKEHKDLALELIQKKFLYTEEFVEEIKRKLPKEISNCDINRILYGNYIFAKDINKRPFAKLTKDILDIFDK